MISRTGKYALQILGYLASHSQKRHSGKEIASGLGIPANYLGKILNILAKHGFVDSKKGWGGGFLLKESAKDSPISEVLSLIEGPEVAGKEGCLFGWPECKDENPCPLHEDWSKILEAYGEMIGKLTIKDLATNLPPKPNCK